MYLIKRALKDSLYRAMALETIRRRVRGSNLRDGIIVLMYHELADDAEEIEAWTVIRKSDFIAQMEYLRKTFSIVSIQEAITLLENNQIIERPTAVITFDDGYSGNRTKLLPIVKAMEIHVTIFVATQAVQDQTLYWYDELIQALQNDRVIQINLEHAHLSRYIINRYRGPRNWKEIQRLLQDLKTLQPANRALVVKDLVLKYRKPINKSYVLKPLTIEDVREVSKCPFITIGAHSHCHNILTQLSEDEIQRSIITSRDLLALWTGKPVIYFSYPNGNYNDGVIRSVQSAGLECGMTTEPRIWTNMNSRFAIPRIGIGRYDSLDQFKIEVSGGLF